MGKVGYNGLTIYFKNTVEFELCGAYSRGTTEIFSLVRFLVCSNASKKDCPPRLNGFDCKPNK